MKRYEMLENLMATARGRLAEIPPRMFSDFDLGHYGPVLEKFDVEMDGFLNRVFAETVDPKLAKDMRNLEFKIQREVDDLMIWVKRSRALPWKDIEAEPFLLMPGRVYSIKTRRGESNEETIRVRFHRTLVEEFYWETRDSGRAMAAHQSLVGVERGERPSTSSAAGGIEFYKAIDGIHLVKIQIVGRQVGGYRVYGCLKNGIFEFVLWEHEGNHDARYLSRVYQHTADLCQPL